MVGSTEEVKIGNKMAKARQYPWGVVQGMLMWTKYVYLYIDINIFTYVLYQWYIFFKSQGSYTSNFLNQQESKTTDVKVVTEIWRIVSDAHQENVSFQHMGFLMRL